jgi:7-keto-8-aminopelargonate synthetase-like enzyme
MFCSFQVLGKTGKGVTEHLDMPLESIDVLSGSLAHSFGSIGGFCVGSQEVVDHQVCVFYVSPICCDSFSCVSFGPPF